jgi:hypothetical protein
MRRLLLLAIPIFALLAVLGWVMIAENARSPLWQVRLDRYVQAERMRSGQQITVLKVIHAGRPFEYTAHLPYPVVDAGEFGMSVSITPQLSPSPTRSAPSDTAKITLSKDQYDATLQTLDLPFSAIEVKCVLITRRAQREVLFVNYYSDALWHAGWVIHQGPHSPFSQEAAAILNRLGCSLEQ